MKWVVEGGLFLLAAPPMVHLTKCSHQRPMTLDYTDLVKHHANGVTLVAFLTKCCLLMLAPVHKSFFFGSRLLFETNYKHPSRAFIITPPHLTPTGCCQWVCKNWKNLLFLLEIQFLCQGKETTKWFQSRTSPFNSNMSKMGQKLLQLWVFERILFPIMILKSVTALKS